MPLYKTITVNPSTQILIWKVEESVEELSQGIQLTNHCQARIKSLKSVSQQLSFLSIRQLFKAVGYADCDVYYDESGKPHLTDDKYISITHSHQFSGIIISSEPVGIDIEKQRNKVLRIANKFTPLSEYKTLANDAAVIRKLTIVWGAKESAYKIMDTPGLSFLKHIYVEDFDFEDASTTVQVNYKGKQRTFYLNFLEFENFTCVYALSSQPV